MYLALKIQWWKSFVEHVAVVATGMDFGKTKHVSCDCFSHSMLISDSIVLLHLLLYYYELRLCYE